MYTRKWYAIQRRIDHEFKEPTLKTNMNSNLKIIHLSAQHSHHIGEMVFYNVALKGIEVGDEAILATCPELHQNTDRRMRAGRAIPAGKTDESS